MDDLEKASPSERPSGALPEAHILSAEEIADYLRGPGMTMNPLTPKEFIGRINTLRGISFERLTLYDFLESSFRLAEEQRERLFRQLDGSVRASYNAYTLVRTAWATLRTTDRQERVSALANELNRAEKSILQYLYSIDADRALIGPPQKRGRKPKNSSGSESRAFPEIQNTYAQVIRDLGKRVSEELIATTLSHPPFNLVVSGLTVRAVLSQPGNASLRKLYESAKRGELE